MTATSYCNGNPAFYDQASGQWLYWDRTPTSDPKPCPRCGHLPTPDGDDACLGHIPGATAACCGHGKDRGYIQYTDGRYVRLIERRKAGEALEAQLLAARKVIAAFDAAWATAAWPSSKAGRVSVDGEAWDELASARREYERDYD